MENLALNYVLKLLAIRDYSEYELRCKMQAKAFSEQEIEQTIANVRRKIGKMTSASVSISYFQECTKVMAYNALNRSYNKRHSK